MGVCEWVNVCVRVHRGCVVSGCLCWKTVRGERDKDEASSNYWDVFTICVNAFSVSLLVLDAWQNICYHIVLRQVSRLSCCQGSYHCVWVIVRMTVWLSGCLYGCPWVCMIVGMLKTAGSVCTLHILNIQLLEMTNNRSSKCDTDITFYGSHHLSTHWKWQTVTDNTFCGIHYLVPH